jgi:hypothetical protein
MIQYGMEKTQPSVASNPLASGLNESTISRYGARHWAIYVNGELLAVTVYKKGALAVRDALLSGTLQFRKSPNRSIPGQGT